MKPIVKDSRLSPSRPEEKSLLLDVQQLSTLLNVGKTSVYALLSRGLLPKPVKLGARSLWQRSEIESWTKAGCPTLEKWLIMKEGVGR